MQFQSYKIADLIPASYNPRKKLKPGDKEYEKIKNSIKEFGYVEPIIINSDMTIIGGHQRATVLADLGYTEVECIVVDIDKTKEKALNVALNKITGEWNKELLADLIKDLDKFICFCKRICLIKTQTYCTSSNLIINMHRNQGACFICCL